MYSWQEIFYNNKAAIYNRQVDKEEIVQPQKAHKNIQTPGKLSFNKNFTAVLSMVLDTW